MAPNHADLIIWQTYSQNADSRHNLDGSSTVNMNYYPNKEFVNVKRNMHVEMYVIYFDKEFSQRQGHMMNTLRIYNNSITKVAKYM